jgi:hypothetical protein
MGAEGGYGHHSVDIPAQVLRVDKGHVRETTLLGHLGVPCYLIYPEASTHSDAEIYFHCGLLLYDN